MTKKNTRRNRIFLSENFTRKSHNTKQMKRKKQSGGFYLESSAIILGMKYIFNREDIKKQWKTGVRSSKLNKEKEKEKEKETVNLTKVTTSDIKICFEKNIEIQESIKKVMGLFFFFIIKTTRKDFRVSIEKRLSAVVVDDNRSRSWNGEIPEDRYKNIVNAVTGIPDTELDEWEYGITYYSPDHNPTYDWGLRSLRDEEKVDLINDITTKILQIFMSKTGIDVGYLTNGQLNCDANSGTDESFFICNKEGAQYHFDVIYRSGDAGDAGIRLKIPGSGYCLYSALSLIYIIKKLNITTSEGLTTHLDDNFFEDYYTIDIEAE